MIVNRIWSEAAACTERWLVFYIVYCHGSCFVITCKINKLQVRTSAYKFNNVSNVKNKCLVQQAIIVETYRDLNGLENLKPNKKI